MATAYKLHPLCEKFPEMPPEEFRELVADMKARGQVDPIWVWGKLILDGKHRMQACEALGTKPDIREWKPKHGPEEPQVRAFVLSKNFYRRHLNPSQRALIVAELVTTNGPGRPKELGINSQLTASEAAEIAGVSRKTVQQASDVVESGSAALQQAVRDGDVSVVDAAKVVDLPKSEQTAAVREVLAGESKTVTEAAGVKKRKPRRKPMKSPSKNGAEHEEREPGQDETEPEHRQTKAFDEKEIENAFGQLVRLLDKRGDAFRCKNGTHHKSCLKHLDDFLKSLKEWRSARKC